MTDPSIVGEDLTIDERLDALRAQLRGLGRVVVAFSGGADSALLAKVATETLGRDNALVVTAVSASLAASELSDCAALAAEWDLRWTEVLTSELTNEDYQRNDADRCFHCKDALMEALAPLAAAEQATVVLGVNLDDLDDHRPGQRAARQHGAEFPFVDAALTKDHVRQISRRLGLRTWDKPAAACLASRVPYGSPVTLSVLSSVERAEAALHALGYAELRVRHYGDLARIEVPVADLARLVDDHEVVVAAVREAGYQYVTVDLEGLRSGNLNQALGLRTGSSPADQSIR